MANFIIRWLDASDGPQPLRRRTTAVSASRGKLPSLERGDAAEIYPYRKLSLRWAMAKWMERHDMAHVRGAPYHPMTHGKIERWHQTLRPSWPTTTTAATTRASTI